MEDVKPIARMGNDFHEWFNKWVIFICTCLIGSSLAGIASLMRNGHSPTLRNILGAAFTSLVVGVIFLSALWDSLASTRPGWLLAVVMCAGAGGGNMLDMVARILKKAVLRYGSKDDNENPKP